MKKSLLVILITLSSLVLAQKAVLIEDGVDSELNNLKQRGKKEVKSDNKWWPSFQTQKEKASQVGDYDQVLDLRAKKRIGIGATLAGQLGFLGALAEFNITKDNAAMIGFGTGFNYSTMSASWKHVFGGGSMSAYTTIGLSKWLGNGSQSVSSTTPSFLAERFLSQSERQSGRFTKDLFSPSIGLQYYNLKGASAGFSIFGELVLISNLSTLESIPTGAVGSIYYF